MPDLRRSADTVGHHTHVIVALVRVGEQETGLLTTSGYLGILSPLFVISYDLEYVDQRQPEAGRPLC